METEIRSGKQGFDFPATSSGLKAFLILVEVKKRMLKREIQDKYGESHEFRINEQPFIEIKQNTDSNIQTSHVFEIAYRTGEHTVG